MENANIVEIANNTNKKRKLRKTHNKSEKAKTTEKPISENAKKKRKGKNCGKRKSLKLQNT